MTTERQDAWTAMDDSVLAQIVLEHIQMGSTQLKAFEEAADRLQRTPAACGFRWNSAVRKQYENDIIQAKQERKRGQTKSFTARLNIANITEKETVRNHPLFAVIKTLNHYIDHEQNNSGSAEHDKLMELLQEKDRQIDSLKKQLTEAQEAQFAVTEDYKALLRILDRARALGALQSVEDSNKAAFKMDANGNIERIG